MIGPSDKESSSLKNVCRQLAASPAVLVAKAAGLALAAFGIFAPTSTQTAIANGDTRTISLFHAHRRDSITVTFRRHGRYDASALSKLNYFLRDWRNNEQIRMDPRLFDVIWESYRMVGGRQPIHVLSSYRSPRTNSMLRRRSRGVAKNSQHMYGRAMDMRFPGVNMHRVREAAMKLQRGGVGWYARTGFVHLDVGSVRAWPRMSYRQLARLFPNGKTVHVASDGRTLPGYDEARALVASRNGAYVPTLAQVRERGFLERLFGWGDSGDEADQNSARRDRRRIARSAPIGATGPAASDDNNSAAFFRRDQARLTDKTKPAAKPAAAAGGSTPAKSTVRAEKIKAPPPPQRQEADAKQPALTAPLPPKRPSEVQIAALIDSAMPDTPLPPQRPEDMIVVAEKAGPLPRDSRGALAALIGSNAPGAIGSKRNLPSVITRGTAVAGHVNAPDALAFAAPLATETGRKISRGRVRKLALRRSVESAPALARAIGVRAAKRAQESGASHLVAARFDRSNFSLMTQPRRFDRALARNLLGSGIVSLRSAVRNNVDTLVFAPPESLTMRFVAPKRRAQAYQRFTALLRKTAH